MRDTYLKQIYVMNSKLSKEFRCLFPVITLLLAILACSKSVDPGLQTMAAHVAETLVTEGKEVVGIEAAHLKETGIAELATQTANLVMEISGSPPDPWDISWLPGDENFAIHQIDVILEGPGMDGQGNAILKYSKEFGVDPGFALAMFRKEAIFASSNTRAHNNKNPGNIIASGDCYTL